MLLFVGAALLAGCASTPDRGPSSASAGYTARDQIAVLLPRSGRYAKAAQAVREGILAARALTDERFRPRVRFYDTADPRSVPARLKRAVADGATLAIGPLRKASVEALARGNALPIPTLALNRVSRSSVPENLYQFSLAPEDEARTVADRAWARGYRRARVISPSKPWATRIARAFRQRWQRLGGQFAADPKGESPSPRTQAAPEMIFLIATSATARRILPELRRRAPDVPIYATSHSVSGGISPELQGLIFVDIPWLVAPDPSDPLSEAQLAKRIPGFEKAYRRLYAMGIDAYQLAPRLTRMAASPTGLGFSGKTGRLRLDGQRRVRRELMLGRLTPRGPVRLSGIETE